MSQTLIATLILSVLLVVPAEAVPAQSVAGVQQTTQTQSQPADRGAPLGPGYAFFVGMLGAFLGYMILYRKTRIDDFLKAPKQNWKILLFDFGVYLICGGLVTVFMVTPYTPKDAFTGGLAWQGIAGGAFAGAELATYKKAQGQ